MRTFENTVRIFYDVKKQVMEKPSLACATDETKLWLSPSAKQCRNLRSGPSPVYQDLSTRHDWPVEKTIVVFPIRMKENWKRTSGNSLSPLGGGGRTRISVLFVDVTYRG